MSTRGAADATPTQDVVGLREQRAALRRLTALVAQRATLDELFGAVVTEVAHVLDAPKAWLLRNEPDGSITVLASRGDPTFPPGSRWASEGLGSLRSVLAEPVVIEGATWGFLCVRTGHGDPPAEVVECVHDVAELLAIAVANAESRDRLRTLADEQVALRRVATLVAEGAALTDLFGAVSHAIVQAIGVGGLALERVDPDRTTTVIASLNASGFQIGSKWPLDGGGLASEIVTTGRPAQLDDAGAVGGRLGEAMRTSGICAAAGAPIVVEGAVWGLIWVGVGVGTPLPAATEARLRDFADLVAIAVANGESRERLRRLADQESSLRRVATLAAEGATPAELFSAVAEEIARILDVSAVSIIAYEPDDSSVVVASYNDPVFAVGTRWPVERPSLNATVRDTRAPARVDDFADETGAVAEGARASNIRSGIGVPIIVDGGVWGMIAVGFRERRGALPVFRGKYTGRLVVSTASPHEIESRLASFTDLVGTALSRAHAHAELSTLAEEQAALHRVATLVARGTASQAVFDAVCSEAGKLVGATSVNLSHYTPSGDNETVAGWSVRDTHVLVGTRFPITPDTIAGKMVKTHTTVRVDSWASGTSELASLVRSRGIRSSVGAPVVVEGRLWGALVAATDSETPLPSVTEYRLARFAELIATAVANAEARSELIASRARIVEAGDEARRRIERDLHDGTQQRLIALGLDLQRVRSTVPAGDGVTRTGLVHVASELESLLAEVQELSRGLHPAQLSRGGLRPSLRALARRSAIPVELDVEIPLRPSPPIETAVYYVVSEALANAAKHSKAQTVSVSVVGDDSVVRATIADDGVGGAERGAGSGLTGLADRVEALGGRFTLASAPRHGTTIEVELPVRAR